jgi:hypothetical protein
MRIGALYRNRKVFWIGLLKQILCLLVVGSVFACLVTIFLRDSIPGRGIMQEILLRRMPNEWDFVLSVLTAIGAGQQMNAMPVQLNGYRSLMMGLCCQACIPLENLPWRR